MNGKLKADLESLYEIARKDVMGISEQYSTLSNQMDPVATDQLDPSIHGGAEGSVMTSGGIKPLRSGNLLQTLRGVAQTMMAQSSRNSEETATALIDVANRYASDDSELEGIFNDLEGDIETGVPSEDNPPAFPPGQHVKSS